MLAAYIISLPLMAATFGASGLVISISVTASLPFCAARESPSCLTTEASLFCSDVSREVLKAVMKLDAGRSPACAVTRLASKRIVMMMRFPLNTQPPEDIFSFKLGRILPHDGKRRNQIL